MNLNEPWEKIVILDGEPVLECLDPNDGVSDDPLDKTRYQYRVLDGKVYRRRLPPASVGDEWADIGVPDWEPMSQTIVFRWLLSQKFLDWREAR